MASGAAKAPSEGSETDRAGSVTAPTADEDERIRALIRAELDRAYASRIARRTLELLAEAAVEPTETEPGYRIVDRSGETRYRQGSEPGSSRGPDPMTLADLVDELKVRYPDLFTKPPEPAPEPVPPAPEQDAMAEMRAVGARFVGQQAALAKSLAANSAERGRAFANRATERVESWRTQLGERLKMPAAPVKAESGGPASGASPDTATEIRTAPSAPPASTERWAALRTAKERLGGLVDLDDGRSVLRRGLAVAGLGALALAAAVAATLVLRRGDTEPPPNPPVAESGKATPAPSATSTTPPPAAEQESKPRADSMAEEASEDPAQNPNALKGVPEVIDTATLKVAGKVVRLFGVEWVRGAQGQDLARYLNGRAVTCVPAPGSTAYTCTVEGRDLSEVVLFNGGGRASSEAAPEHIAAEDHARTERLGVWRR